MHSLRRSNFQDYNLRGMSPYNCDIQMISDPEQANAGDSRSVLGVKGRAKPLSYDHKPQNEGRRRPCIAGTPQMLTW